MRVLNYIYQIFKKIPFLVTVNTLLVLLISAIEGATIFSLVVIVDLFLDSTLQASSPISQKIISLLARLGLPFTLTWFIMIVILFTILKICLQILSMYVGLKSKYKLWRDILYGTFDDFLNARWYFFSSGKQGILLNTFLRELDEVSNSFAVMIAYFADILQVILFLAVPFYLSWEVTSAAIIMGLFFSAPFFMLGRFSYQLGKMNTITANEATSVIQETLSFMKLILGFANQHKSMKALKQSCDNHYLATIKSQVFNNSLPLAHHFFIFIILIVGLLISRKISMPLSETAVLFYSLARIIPIVGKITGYKAILDSAYPSFQQIGNLRQRARELPQTSGSKIFTGFEKEIRVEDLTFAYPEHEPVLNNINLVVPKGKMIAVVGSSGVGKSTFIDMIMWFHDPVSGKITIDGTDLKYFDVNSYRQRIGYVPQESILFNMTIKENLFWAKEFASDNEIKNACKQAYAEEFINRLPKGYDTLVGDRGVRLSGGQVQRVALARAILRKPDLLILDEATSNLDTYSERLIQQAIENIAKETTVIIIAHRLSTIKNADYIYVLKDGTIVEEGSYSDLIQISGYFNRMVNLQALDTAKKT